jgi:alginate O-acetyltransferase complex protein AlgI
VNLNQILLFAGGIFIYRLILNQKWKAWVLFIGSLLGIFWLQPASLIRNLDYWFPFASIVLILITWLVITPRGKIIGRRNIFSLLIILGVTFLVSIIRYFPYHLLITPTLPPQPLIVFEAILVLVIIILLVYFIRNNKISPILQLLIILGLFIVLKNPQLQKILVNFIKQISGQSFAVTPENHINFSWLGFSYIAFRLIHTLRDYQNTRYQPVDLYLYFDYVIYFPAVVAGPIDRIEHFEKEIKKTTLLFDDVLVGGRRLILGLIKKFVIADFLFIFSINQENTFLVRSVIWLWLMVFAYAWMIFFDFSGYTDIAIGLSALMGIVLPENFNRPYLASNLTTFWNRWHMTLTQWIRSYFYYPLTRFLRIKTKTMPQSLMNAIPQVSTMVLIGLWHGITLNFFIWGLWHALGLIVHNRWSGWMQKTGFSDRIKAPFNKIFTFLSILSTFIYVSLGWIWFTIPDVQGAVTILLKLIGR